MSPIRPRAAQHVRIDTAEVVRGVGDDATLVARVRGGDADAFAALFRAHYDGLCRFVETYVGVGASAEEVISGLFTDLWARRERWALQGTLKAYLYTAARHRALNARRHERTVRQAAAVMLANIEETTAPPAMGVPSVAADVAVDVRERDAALRRAIETLPERYRPVFHLRWHEGMSCVEIAKVLGMPVKTVETHSARAIHVLRDVLVRFRR